MKSSSLDDMWFPSLPKKCLECNMPIPLGFAVCDICAVFICGEVGDFSFEKEDESLKDKKVSDVHNPMYHELKA